jgi:hypothetical protein
MGPAKTSPHVAKARFDPSHPDALAIYCSDGRFTEAVEELLHARGHSRLDTMTLPGGPALFELMTTDFAGLETARSAAAFLVRGHAIEHVVLIAHEGCGYYRARTLGHDPARIVDRQMSDLRSAARWFYASLPGVNVALFYAAPPEGRFRFIRSRRAETAGLKVWPQMAARPFTVSWFFGAPPPKASSVTDSRSRSQSAHIPASTGPPADGPIPVPGFITAIASTSTASRPMIPAVIVMLLVAPPFRAVGIV